MLPKITGLEILKLEERSSHLAVPVLMLTGLSLKNAKQMEKDGAGGFLEKSNAMLGNGADALLATIDRILNKPNSR